MGNGGSVGGAFQPYLDSLRQELQQGDPTLLSVAVALLVVLLTLGKEAAVVMAGAGRASDRERGAAKALERRLEREMPLIPSFPAACSSGGALR